MRCRHRHEGLRQHRSHRAHQRHHRLRAHGYRGAGVILWVIACIACFVLGKLTGEGKLSWNWVRGAAGKARDAVLGLRPVASVGDNLSRTEVSPPPANKPISAGKAIANVLGFFGGLLAWMAKNPVLAIGLVVLACLLVFGLPFGLGKSKGELRLEREIAQREAQFQETLRERDEAITAIRTETARTLQQIRLESQRGHDAIAAATPEHEEPIDPALVAAFRDALDGLCVPRADGTRSDPCRS